ncbi:hypothetical protein GGQ74_003166 [Desulfobaculum xiamenense]|uniref:Uncharacterized protein n=1 Tax=Desulfobaculum xiamenense TaxID=995050 RepID=A0A846QWH7_9BACT|nr:hypothetical protein [Desulfobaculum xiamenense]NJB69464.1 hypothetical protein [Desulfobaculum xiamenense]
MDIVQEAMNRAGSMLGVRPDGVLSLKAALVVPCARRREDIMGFEFTLCLENGCYGFFDALPPHTGRTQPHPVRGPIGMRLMREVALDIGDAIDRFHESGGPYFSEIFLYWPLTAQCREPLWFFRSWGTNHVIIGAQSGESQHSIGYDL